MKQADADTLAAREQADADIAQADAGARRREGGAMRAEIKHCVRAFRQALANVPVNRAIADGDHHRR